MTITTPKGKHKVELKEWISGAEYEDIYRPMTNFQMAVKNKDVEFGMHVGEAREEMKKKSIEVVVLSVDGDKKDILNKVREMRKEDYLFILEKVDEIIAGDFTQP